MCGVEHYFPEYSDGRVVCEADGRLCQVLEGQLLTGWGEDVF
jgi:hypothetical protein